MKKVNKARKLQNDEQLKFQFNILHCVQAIAPSNHSAPQCDFKRHETKLFTLLKLAVYKCHNENETEVHCYRCSDAMLARVVMSRRRKWEQRHLVSEYAVMITQTRALIFPDFPLNTVFHPVYDLGKVEKGRKKNECNTISSLDCSFVPSLLLICDIIFIIMIIIINTGIVIPHYYVFTLSFCPWLIGKVGVEFNLTFKIEYASSMFNHSNEMWFQFRLSRHRWWQNFPLLLVVMQTSCRQYEMMMIIVHKNDSIHCVIILVLLSNFKLKQLLSIMMKIFIIFSFLH